MHVISTVLLITVRAIVKKGIVILMVLDLKCDVWISHHSSQPAQSCIDESQNGKKSNQVGSYVSHKPNRCRCSRRSSLQDILLFTNQEQQIDRQINAKLGKMPHIMNTAMSLFYGNLPAFYFNIVFRFELGLFCFRIWKFGHGQCTWSSHYRGSDQRGSINLYQHKR